MRLTGRPDAGGTSEVALTVRNHGPNPAVGVHVTITLVGAADLGRLPPSCGEDSAGTLVCALGELRSGAAVERVLVLRARGPVTVGAVVRSSRGHDEHPVNDRAELEV